MQCTGFSFHFENQLGADEAVELMQQSIGQAGRAKSKGADVGRLRLLPKGFYVPWFRPAGFDAARSWFRRRVGGKKDVGVSVCGHVAPCPDDGNFGADIVLVPATISGTLASVFSVACPGAPETAPDAGHAASSTDARPGPHFFPIACWSLLLMGDHSLLKGTRWRTTKLRHALGHGTFGTVFSVEEGSGRFAVKRLRAPFGDSMEAVTEVYALERCLGVPSIIQIFDVFLHGAPPHVHIVLELWGTDLHEELRLQQALGLTGLAPADIRRVVEDTLKGLYFLHTTLKMAHTDVKPANILVQRNGGPGQEALACKLSDLGNVMQVFFACTGWEIRGREGCYP
jgi:hypothetical protein